MPFVVSGSDSKAFAPAPEGAHRAVCVDIIDKGLQPNPFQPGTSHKKVDVAWQIEETREDGKRFVVYKRYTASLNEKATLRQDLESWRGKPFTATELAGFDLETVIGANCILNLVHKPGTKNPGKVFANVAAVMPLMRGLPKLTAVGYERPAPQDEAVPPQHDEEYPGDIMDEPPFAWLLPLVMPLTGALSAWTLLS